MQIEEAMKQNTTNIGDKIGRWTVLEKCTNYRKLLCKCDCGTIKEVWKGHLAHGKTISCGCFRADLHKKDLSGQTFGRLKVIKRANNIGDRTAWICRCECGKTTTVRTTCLTSGGTKSCGCKFKKDLKRMENHYRWKGGTYISANGYVVKYLGHGKEKTEHRIIAEQKLKRKLMSNEIVHHINHNKTDNRPENLAVMTQSEHMKVHLIDAKKHKGSNLCK